MFLLCKHPSSNIPDYRYYICMRTYTHIKMLLYIGIQLLFIISIIYSFIICMHAYMHAMRMHAGGLKTT